MNCDMFEKFCIYVSNFSQTQKTYIYLYNSILEKDLLVPTYCSFQFNEKTIQAMLERHFTNYEHKQHYMEWQVDCEEKDIESICNSNFSYTKDHNNVFTWSFGKWTFYQAKRKRSMSSVYLPKEINLLQDVQNFFNDQSFYEKLQIPHSRLYLLEGLPGTGKTSLIHGLASEYNFCLAFLELHSFNSLSEVKQAFKELPTNSIVVMEDIDSLFQDRKSISQVPFSTFINILDGLISQEHLIIIATTNYSDKLDIALKRRFDRIYKFSYVKPEQLMKLGVTEDDANYFTKYRTTVNVVQKFLTQRKDKKDFPEFNSEYMNQIQEYQSMYA